ncbi:NAD-dependent epimerase/dehydratase family protein [uncultured Tenacibaculum sp.]|uniref:NAD-dependent epimerase/dehydratase family protein n=1 Tax=uncultured Tenacibaculum sp. TaxID=174713 RepID=UPI002610BC68|nr:NAD-dependent epimerase/dehydratase family protein [uncultured Tenacibaculum sp.]
MKVLITGGRGFLGRNLAESFSTKFEVLTLGRNNANYEVDLSKTVPKFEDEFEFVIHAAGKAHIVPKTAEEKEAFFSVNTEGTKNLLKALNSVKSSIQTFVFISTVAVYGKEVGENISEKHSLDGTTPYALSKIKAEELVQDWCKHNNVNCLILRLPLLAGPNPPGNLGAMIKGIKNNRYFSIHKGKAKRSIVLVDDIAKMLLENLDKNGIYNLTDDYNPSFRELEFVIASQLNKKNPKSIPIVFAKILGLIGDVITILPVNSYKVSKMISDLTFNCEKAKIDLNWKPKKVVNNFVITKK